MKPKDMFGLAVRIIGLVFVYQGLTAVPNAITSICPIFPHFFWRNLFPSALIVGWPLFIGSWLLKGAPRLMRLAYPKETGETSNSSAPSF